jgi:hypothetical protein
MGAAAESLNTMLGIDTTDFKAGLTSANRELRVLESGFKASVSTLGDWANSISGVELRQKNLTSQITIQKAKVEALREEQQRLADTEGDTSVAAKNAEVQLNKETERLGKMQTELDGTVTALENLKAGNDAAGRSTQELANKQQPLSEVFKNSWTEINSAIGVAKEVWGALKGAVDETVGAYVDYADQVRQLNQLNGNSSESNSRLIQLTDDYKVSMEDLMSTQKELLKDGKLLSTETLADIADKYNAAATQAEKNKIASDNLGKSWKSYIELLQKGGTAIRDESAAINGSLILTDQAVAKARDYEKATDELSDSFQGVKVAIGQKVVPALTTYFNKLSNGISVQDAYRRANELGLKVMINHSTNTIRINGQLATQEDLFLAVAEAEKKQTGTTEDATKATDALADSMDAATTSTDMFGYTVADGVDALQQANSEFGFIISFAKQYEQNLTNVKDAQDALKEAEDELFATSQPGWEGTAEQVQNAQDKVDELKGKLKDAQQASLDATNEMIAGFLQAQLTADGSFTEEDIQKVLDYRLAVGLLTQESYNAALQALAVAQNLAGIPKSVVSNVTVNTTYKYSGLAPGPNDIEALKPHPQATGGDYLVRKPTLFLAGEAGTERATFTPINSGMNDAVRQLENAVMNLTGKNSSQLSSGGGSSSSQNRTEPINVNVQAALNNDIDIHKMAIIVAEEIERNRKR